MVPLVIGGLGLFLVVAAIFLGGEVLTFATYGLAIAPLAILATLAYNGARSSTAAVLTYMWLGILSIAVLFNAFVTVLSFYVKDMALLTQITQRFAQGDQSALTSVSRDALFYPGIGPGLLATTLLLGLSVLISLAMLLRPVRVRMSRFVPVDPDNFVHKIALTTILLITLCSLVPLIALGGEPPLLRAVSSGQIQNAANGTSLVGPLGVVYQFVWTIPAALVAAGWPMVRNWRQTLERLGVVKPSLKQALAGVGMGLLLVVVSAFALDPGIHMIWQAFGWPTTDTAAFEGLLGKLISPAGAVLIGVTAGIGEEITVRGLLQPRVGLILSNLFFTSLHASQYGLDGLLSVFIIGSILGIIRSRSNTTTSAITHGVYDFVLVMLSFLAASGAH